MLTETFSHNEYETRLSRVQLRLVEQGISHLFVTDPANIYYLTGYDADPRRAAGAPRPQPWRDVLLLQGGRCASAWLTTVLEERQVFGYPERYVQQPDIHPMDGGGPTEDPADAGGGRRAGGRGRIAPTWRREHTGRSSPDSARRSDDTGSRGRELGARHQVSSRDRLDARSGWIVNRVSSVAAEVVRPGVRECDAVAEIYEGFRGAGVGGT